MSSLRTIARGRRRAPTRRGPRGGSARPWGDRGTHDVHQRASCPSPKRPRWPRTAPAGPRRRRPRARAPRPCPSRTACGSRAARGPRSRGRVGRRAVHQNILGGRAVVVVAGRAVVFGLVDDDLRALDELRRRDLGVHAVGEPDDHRHARRASVAQHVDPAALGRVAARAAVSPAASATPRRDAAVFAGRSVAARALDACVGARRRRRARAVAQGRVGNAQHGLVARGDGGDRRGHSGAQPRLRVVDVDHGL